MYIYTDTEKAPKKNGLKSSKNYLRNSDNPENLGSDKGCKYLKNKKL
jgi:hypothetical protein